MFSFDIFMDDHGQDWGHRVVHTLQPTVDVRMAGAGANFANP